MAAAERILRRQALLVGDSITQFGVSIDVESGVGPGWVAILQDKFIRRVDMINRGYSGYNTRKILAILPMVLQEFEGRKEQMLFSTLFLGANDSAPIEDDPLCSGVPLDEYTNNLTEIARRLQAMSEMLVIIGPGPVEEDGSGAYGRTMENTVKYADAAKSVAAAVDAKYVDLFNEMQAGGLNWKKMLCDGLHMATAGNAFIAKCVLDQLAPDVTPAISTWDLPGWRDLDRDNPQKSLGRDQAMKLGFRNCLEEAEPVS